MAEWTGRHRDELAGLPHYHVIAENHDDEVIYSDGFTWPRARVRRGSDYTACGCPHS